MKKSAKILILLAIPLLLLAVAGGVGSFMGFQTILGGDDQRFVLQDSESSHTVTLDEPGSFMVWHDYRTQFEGEFYTNPELSIVEVQVKSVATGEDIPVSVSGATRESPNMNSKGLVVFTITEPGDYEIRVPAVVQPSVFSIGPPFMEAFFFVFAFTAVAIIAGMLGGLCLLLGIIFLFLGKTLKPAQSQP